MVNIVCDKYSMFIIIYSMVYEGYVDRKVYRFILYSFCFYIVWKIVKKRE